MASYLVILRFFNRVCWAKVNPHFRMTFPEAALSSAHTATNPITPSSFRDHTIPPEGVVSCLGRLAYIPHMIFHSFDCLNDSPIIER